MAKDARDSDEDESPPALEIATRLERLGRLLRQAGHAGGLVPAQWEVLRYLARANRLSRSPGAVARYLGTTKGTVSQSLLTLQKKGLVTRRTSAVDERQVLLDLTEAGRAKLAADPLQALAADLDALGGKTRRRFARGLSDLLSAEITARRPPASAPATAAPTGPSATAGPPAPSTRPRSIPRSSICSAPASHWKEALNPAFYRRRTSLPHPGRAPHMSVTPLPASGVSLIRLSDYGRDILQAIRAGFTSHRVVYAIATIAYVWGIIECSLVGLPVNYGLISLVSGSSFIFLFVLVGAWLAWDLVRLWRGGYAGRPSIASSTACRPTSLRPPASPMPCTPFSPTAFSSSASSPSRNPFRWPFPSPGTRR